MSRLTKIMVALLASTAIAAPAFAITGDVSGFLHVRGVAADNMDGRDKDGNLTTYKTLDDGTVVKDYTTDDNTRAVDSRLRLFTTAALNENVKAVFTVEVDYVWGDTDNDPNTTSIGRVGSDTTSQIEIANLYLDFNIPEANTNVKAGTHYYKMGGGLILGEHASGVSTRTAFDENTNLGLYWAKVIEGVDENDGADVDFYQAQLDMKVGEHTISPFVAYYDADDNQIMQYGPTTTIDNMILEQQYYYGLELKGKIDAFEYSGVAFYNDGRMKADVDNDGTLDTLSTDAFAFLANAGYTLGDTKLIAEAARYGDSDSPTGEMVTVAGFNNFSEILTGGYFDVRAGAGGVDQTVATNRLGRTISGNGSYYMNFQYAKLGVEQKVSEKSKIRAYYIYAEEAADNQVRFLSNGKSMKRITFGHELDLYYDYTVVPGLIATLGGGYLLADDDFGYDVIGTKEIGGDDAWKAGLGLAYKF
ncbi:hypothetical protein [Trichloromonas acetexigens]|uniref:Porin n=1 Tax=Trichloromonas acetexigens TaxID=38815 RepID=A0A550JGC0_9BACT|nr:hypothetical protein [Desulfuromonas acetexigens]TRO82231.1 hypothetical protein FL622_06540 [Desulfuromonas acetexigens]